MIIGSPTGRRFLDFPDQIRRRVSGLQADKKVNMVVDSADGLRNASESSHSSSQVCVQGRAPLRPDIGTTFFGAENDVVMQAVKC